MAQRAAVRPHATYIPQPPRPQRAPVSHAALVAPPHPVPAHAPRQAAKRAEKHAWVAGLISIDAALIAAIGLALVIVVRHLPAVFHGVNGHYLFSALVAGTFLILIRSHVDGHGDRLPRPTGTGGDRSTDRATALLSLSATGELILLAAVLLAWGEAAIAAILAA